MIKRGRRAVGSVLATTMALGAIGAVTPAVVTHVQANTPNPATDFTYEVVNGGAKITEYKGSRKDVVIPDYLGGVPVTVVSTNAFYEKGLTSLVLPNTLEVVGEGAFRKNLLTYVEIPEHVTNIGIHAFSENQLTSIKLSGSIKEIGGSAFYKNKIKNLEVPEGIEELGGAFSHNEIETVSLPSTLKVIKAQALASNKLKYVEIPEGTTTIEARAFADNPLTDVLVPPSVVVIPEFAFLFSKSGDPSFDATVTVHGMSGSLAHTYANEKGHMFNPLLDIQAFNYDYTISGGEITITNYKGSATNVVIPSTIEGKPVTKIGQNAFKNKGIKSVKIPNTVTEIGDGAFEGNNPTEFGDGDGDGDFEGNNLTEVVIPSSVTTIGEGAFANNNLTTVTIPPSVTSIGSTSFDGNDPNLEIKAKEGSYAEGYADTMGYTFTKTTFSGGVVEGETTAERTAQFHLLGGDLTLSVPEIENFQDAQLKAEMQTVETSFRNTINVTDTRGTGEGWRLNVSATPLRVVEPEGGFKAGTTAYVMPVGTLTIKPLSAIERVAGSGIMPTSLLNLEAIIDDGMVSVAVADVGEGEGEFELQFDTNTLAITFDSTTAKVDKVNYPDTATPYETTLTWDLVSAP